jgi:replicative DNA helicase
MAKPNLKPANSDPETSRIKVPPHSLEAEQAVLGGLMLDNRRFDEISEMISAVDFYRQDHRLIFGAVERLASENEPLDVVTLAEFLERAGDIEHAGGLSYLAELAEKTPGAANIRAYADIVRERSILRQLWRHRGKFPIRPSIRWAATAVKFWTKPSARCSRLPSRGLKKVQALRALIRFLRKP